MITLTIELGRDTAAKLDRRAAENRRSLDAELLFILSEGDITRGHLFPEGSGVFISPGGDITARSASEATA